VGRVFNPNKVKADEGKERVGIKVTLLVRHLYVFTSSYDGSF
jgi:hypothetical protein